MKNQIQKRMMYTMQNNKKVLKIIGIVTLAASVASIVSYMLYIIFNCKREFEAFDDDVDFSEVEDYSFYE